MSDTRMTLHADLVAGMANPVGIDLEEELMRGALSTEDLGDAILSCTGCTFPDECGQWLATLEGEVDAPPSGCRNASLFALLQDNEQVQR